MRRGLLTIAALGLGGVVGTVILGQALVGTTVGVDEAVTLQDTLRAAYAVHLEPEPPLKVLRVPGSEEWAGWRWKIEATLKRASDPAAPAVSRALDRLAQRALETRVQGRAPSGVMLDLRRGEDAPRRILYDRTGRRLPAPGAPK